MLIAAGHAKSALPSSPATTLNTEQILKKVTELAASEPTDTAGVETLPPRRWTEILACAPVAAKLIVGLALLRVLEDLVSFCNFLEAGLGVGLLADIRMIFASKLAVRTLYLVLRRSFRNTQNVVVVLVFHGSLGKRKDAGGTLPARSLSLCQTN